MADIKPPLSGNQSVRDVINNVEKQEALSKKEGNSTSVQERLSSIESMLKYNKTADDVKKIGEAVGDIQKKIQSLIETVNNKPIQNRTRELTPVAALSEEDQLFQELQQSNKKLGASNVTLERELRNSLNRRKEADTESSDLERELNEALAGEEEGSRKRKKQKEEYKSKLQLAEEKKKKEKEEAQLEAEEEQKYKESLTFGSKTKKFLGDAFKHSDEKPMSMGEQMTASNDKFFDWLSNPTLKQVEKPGADKLKEARNAKSDIDSGDDDEVSDSARSQPFNKQSNRRGRSGRSGVGGDSTDLGDKLDELLSQKEEYKKSSDNPASDLDKLLSDSEEEVKEKKEYKSKLQLAQEKKQKEREDAKKEADAELEYKESLTFGSKVKKFVGDAFKPSDDKPMSMGAQMTDSNDKFFDWLSNPTLKQVEKPGADKLKEARDVQKVDPKEASVNSIQNSLNTMLDEEYQKENANLIAKTVVKQFKKEKMFGGAGGEEGSDDSEKEESEDTLMSLIQDKAADKLENMLMKGGKNVLGKSKGLGGKALGAAGKAAAVAGIGMSAYGAYSAFSDDKVAEAKAAELRDQSVGERALGALNPLEGGKAIGTAGKLGTDIYKSKAEESRVEEEAGKTASNLDIDFDGRVAKYKAAKTQGGAPVSEELARAKAAAESIKMAGIGPSSYIETQDSSSMEPEEKKIAAEISTMLNTLNVDIDDKSGKVKNKEDVEGKLNNIKTIKTKWNELKTLGEKGVNSPWRGNDELVKNGDELYGTTLTDMSKILEEYIKKSDVAKEPTVITPTQPATTSTPTTPKVITPTQPATTSTPTTPKDSSPVQATQTISTESTTQKYSATQALNDITKESSSVAKATSESGNQGVVASINSSLVGAFDGIKQMLAEESKNKQPNQIFMSSNTSSPPQDNKSYDLAKMLSTGIIGGSYG